MKSPAPEWPLPRVVAHRCGGSLAPENTLAGLPITAALGFGAVEFDVMLSADNTPWLIHDETLERTSNGKGLVSATPDSVLQSLDAGAYYHRSFVGEPLPRFEAVARRCQQLGLQANVEIKPATGFEAITGEIVAQHILQLWQGLPLPLISSFSEVALAAARRVSERLPLGYLCDEPPADWPERLAAVQGYSLHCSNKVSDADLARARALEVPVLCWTINDRALAESLLKRGVNSVICDRIDRMRGL